MRTSNQQYGYKPRNLFRTLLALWSLLREGAHETYDLWHLLNDPNLPIRLS